MNYVPVNGLRILAVETGVLASLWVATLVWLRLSPKPILPPRWLHWILLRNSRAVVFVILLALAGRAALLPVRGVPQPRIDDEYSNLLMADTFAHHRIANPTPAAWQHFETFHVNMLPTYHAKYPVAQGVFLAFGQIVFHQPWIGVYLSTALLCGAICWALLAVVPPGWALLGGLLAVFRLALLSYWMNSYWGGSVAALAGALAIGAVVRLFRHEETSRDRVAYSTVLGTSLLMLANSRPYEGLAFALPLLAYFAWQMGRLVATSKADVAAVLAPALVIGMAGMTAMGYYNWRTTGNALLLPHLLNERTYSPLPLFLWQSRKADFQFRDAAFEKFFTVTEAEYGYRQDRTASAMTALEIKRLLENWFFYVGPALSLPVLAGLLAMLQQRRLWIVAAAGLSTAVALALCTYTMPHYAAPATIVIYLAAIEGMRRLWELGGSGERALVAAIGLSTMIVSLTGQTGSSALNNRFAFADTRRLVTTQLAEIAGKHLVLVSYAMERHYPGNELVHNGADFASTKILWARSKGAGKDSDLCAAYPDRSFWRLTTDDEQTSLVRLGQCE